MQTPIVIVNFKTYEQATGKRAEDLAKACDIPNVAIAVQNTDIYRVSEHVKIPVLAEHIDAAGLGGFTGKDTFLAIQENGAVGALINHSEDRVPIETIKKLVKTCHEKKLISVVCCKDGDEAEKLAIFSPDFIAVEPPELIGGDVSVSRARPEIIENTVKKVRAVNKEIKVLCGAGVHDESDVRVAIHLGAKGILVASAVTKSLDPRKKVEELVKGLR